MTEIQAEIFCDLSNIFAFLPRDFNYEFKKWVFYFINLYKF